MLQVTDACTEPQRQALREREANWKDPGTSSGDLAVARHDRLLHDIAVRRRRFREKDNEEVRPPDFLRDDFLRPVELRVPFVRNEDA
jgi:hypothetical protein